MEEVDGICEWRSGARCRLELSALKFAGWAYLVGMFENIRELLTSAAEKTAHLRRFL